MDPFGCFTPSEEDWKSLATMLKAYGKVTFPYSDGHGTAWIVSIVHQDPNTVVGVMPWGGPVADTYLVSLRLQGCNYFSLGRDREPHHPDYVAAKLRITEYGGSYIAELLTKIGEYL